MIKEEYKQIQWNKTHRINIDGTIERKCSKCGEWKEENNKNFYMMNKSKPELGYCPSCKHCNLIRANEYQTRHKEEQKLRRKKYRDNNLNKEINYNKNWRENNRSHVQEYTKEYQQNNPEKMKYYGQNRKHKNHKITKTEWKSCKNYFNNTCAYCGLPIEEHWITYRGVRKLGDFHKEHKDDNGLNDLSNCIPSCESCNSKKWKFEFDDWYNLDNPIFSQERLNQINKWINEDYRLYINKK